MWKVFNVAYETVFLILFVGFVVYGYYYVITAELLPGPRLVGFMGTVAFSLTAVPKQFECLTKALEE